ncbi:MULTISPECIES: hypothetical protein [unclassified Streptomyces]|uniref:hypothetical protein n=1 Tax=unclassified Streptomyces TaxID=2593676 RepID=UPI0040419120
MIAVRAGAGPAAPWGRIVHGGSAATRGWTPAVRDPRMAIGLLQRVRRGWPRKPAVGFRERV